MAHDMMLSVHLHRVTANTSYPPPLIHLPWETLFFLPHRTAELRLIMAEENEALRCNSWLHRLLGKTIWTLQRTHPCQGLMLSIAYLMGRDKRTVGTRHPHRRPPSMLTGRSRDKRLRLLRLAGR